MLWFKLKHKVKEILRAQTKYSKDEIQQTNGQSTCIVLAQNS